MKLKRRYKLDAPKGVRGRNSDNTLIKQKLGWAPSIALATAWRRPIAGFTTRLHKSTEQRRRVYR